MTTRTSLSVSDWQARPTHHRWRLLRVMLPVLLLLALLAQTTRPAPALAASWTTEASGTTNDLFDVSCVTTMFCKAVGAGNTIRSFNGSSWSADTAPGSDYWGVSCATLTFCKAAGPDYGPNISSYRGGTAWTADTAPSFPVLPGGLSGMACVSASFCKAVGNDAQNQAVVLSWNGSTWGRDSVGLSGRLRGVSCLSAFFCKAVGANGFILSYDGSRWTTNYSGTTTGFSSVSCVTTSFCKAVGAGGFVITFVGGGDWVRDTNGVTTDLRGIACVSSSFCKATGYGGTILSWDGARWTPDSSGTTVNLVRVTCVSTGFCKAVGANGTMLSLVAPAPTPLPVTISFGGCTPDGPYYQTATCLVSLRDSGSVPAVASGQVTLSFLDGQARLIGQYVRRCPEDGGMGGNRCSAVGVSVPFGLWTAAIYLQVDYQPDAGLGVNTAAQNAFVIH